MRLPLLGPRSRKVQRGRPQAIAVAMRVVPVPEVEERVAAEDAGAVASKGVVEAEGEEGV